MGDFWGPSSSSWILKLVLFGSVLLVCRGQLSPGFYDRNCPLLQRTVTAGFLRAAASDPHLGPALLRLFFHDCFVNGCDGSVLLDDTPTLEGEKNAKANAKSLRGFEAVDEVKALVEQICPNTVSCADVLALLARDGVVANGGPRWEVELGRRDSLTASKAAADESLPDQRWDVAALVANFASQGLDETDLVALSGGHTFGRARCSSFAYRLYSFAETGSADPAMDPKYAALLQERCPKDVEGGGSDLDVTSPSQFDSFYFRNLLVNRGLLHSDQVLAAGGPVRGLVGRFAVDQAAFFAQFEASMVKLGALGPKSGEGEIRRSCRFVNP